MRMHPADIAKEVQNYYFFNIFKEKFLLEICTMIEAKSYAAGDCIIIEGQDNKNLYFLRKGNFEIYMGSQLLTELTEVGEVVGEMSVVTCQKATTTVLAKNEVEAFVIDTTHFVHFKPSEKEHFELMLYKILCNILVARLNKENIKNKNISL